MIVFSHTPSQTALVKSLSSQLAPIVCWSRHLSSKPSSDEISEKIEGCALFVPIVTDEWGESGVLRDEYHCAKRLNLTLERPNIVPLMLSSQLSQHLPRSVRLMIAVFPPIWCDSPESFLSVITPLQAEYRNVVSTEEAVQLSPPPSSHTTLTTWGVQEVVAWLHTIGLNSVAGRFEAEVVTGPMLAEAEERELRDSLGLTRMQCSHLLKKRTEALLDKGVEIGGTTQLSPSKDTVEAAHAINVLVRRLESNDPGVLAQTCQDLKLYAFAGSNKRRVAESGGVPKLVNLLDHTSPNVVSKASIAIWTLIAYSDENKRTVAASGAVGKMIGQLSPTAPHEMLENVLGALKDLIRLKEIKDDFTRHAGLARVTSLLAHSEIQVQENAALCLWNGIAYDDRNKRQVIECGGVPLLLACMDTPHDSLRENVTGIIKDLAWVRENKTLLGEQGAIEALVRRLGDSKTSVVQIAALAIWNVIAYEPQNKRRVMNAGGLAKLMVVINLGDKKARENALGALKDLALDETCRVRLRALSGLRESLEALTRSLNPQDDRDSLLYVQTALTQIFD